MNINEHLVKAIVDIAVFLEYTDPELLDEDIAVKVMEQLAAELQQMAESDQQQLARQIIGFSQLYERPQREFVQGLPEALGLT